jgi:hypothetical protein
MGIIKSTGSTPPYTTGLVIFQERVNHRLPAAPPKPGVVLVHGRHAGFATLHPTGCRGSQPNGMDPGSRHLLVNYSEPR